MFIIFAILFSLAVAILTIINAKMKTDIVDQEIYRADEDEKRKR